MNHQIRPLTWWCKRLLEGFKLSDFTFITEFTEFITGLDVIQTWDEQLVVDGINERVEAIKWISELILNEKSLKKNHDIIIHLFLAFCFIQVQLIKSQIISFKERLTQYCEFHGFSKKIDELGTHLLKKMMSVKT